MGKIKCLKCDTILDSEYRHDFKTCECANQAFVDGGDDYMRIGAVDMSLIKIWDEEESKWKKLDTFKTPKIKIKFQHLLINIIKLIIDKLGKLSEKIQKNV